MKPGDLLRFKETGCIGLVVEPVQNHAVRVLVQWVDEDTKKNTSEMLAFSKAYLLECADLQKVAV